MTKKDKKTRQPKNKVGKKVINSAIGGQAVIEGVMMRGRTSMATAVRDENNNIVIESSYIKPVKQKNFLFRVPFLRGIFNFVSTMVVGMKTLMRSGEVFDGEAQPSKFESWCAKKLNINVYSIIMAFAVIVGIGISIALFYFLPQFIASGIQKIFKIDTSLNIGVKIGMNFLEGFIRMLIFVGYIALTSLMKDVKRTYLYHGAEHKTISCYEHGLELTVENARKMPKAHDRCGTTFMFIIMVVSVLIFSLTGWSDNLWVRIGLRLALLPIVSGISYEVLKLLARWDNWFVRILKAPGMWLQKLTTKEPTDDMLEVAIAAFTTVMKMDEDSTVPVRYFDTKLNMNKAISQVSEIIGQKAEASDIDWIFAKVLGVKRDKVKEVSHIKTSQLIQAKEYATKVAEGVPLWQIFGDTDFYGYTIKINDKVLCPRPETELVCEQAILRADQNSKVLDMCCGSGAIAIAIAKQKGASVLACDISDDALEIAKQNIADNAVESLVTTLKTDMFNSVEGKFDIIISNPPYIPTQDIETLDTQVKEHEPHLALDGGNDGLDFYRVIAQDAKKYLNPNGKIVLECGIGQAQQIVDMLNNEFDCEIKKDLQGIDRIIVGELR